MDTIDPEAVDEDTLDPGEEYEAPVEAAGQVLRPNRAINEQEMTDFRGTTRLKTVVLVGEQKSGKTTLLASLFGQFCKGPVGRFSFAGSRTLLEFAERHHLALEKSKRKSPAVPRTSRAEPVGFFHLCLADGDDRFDLVISDRSGEAFDEARKNTKLIEKLTELPLADIVCFLLDAGKLTNIDTRAGYKRKFKETIKALVDNGALPATAKIEILVTKVDKIQRKDADPALESDLDAYEEQLRAEFTKRLGSFEIYRVCALPRAKVSMGVYGLDQMIERWCLPMPVATTVPIAVEGAERHLDRLVKIWGAK